MVIVHIIYDHNSLLIMLMKPDCFKCVTKYAKIRLHRKISYRTSCFKLKWRNSAVMWTLSSFLIYLFIYFFWAETPFAFSLTLALSLSSLLKEFVSFGHTSIAHIATDSELHVFSARRKWEISESFADFWPGSSSLERCRRCPDTGSSSRIFLLPASGKPARKLAVRFRSFLVPPAVPQNLVCRLPSQSFWSSEALSEYTNTHNDAQKGSLGRQHTWFWRTV